MNVLITGGTGMIGKALTKALLKKGHTVTILTRHPKEVTSGSISYAKWDPAAGIIDSYAVEKADAIIHLAGANVADGRWTQKRKKEILDSRVQSGKLLVKALQEAQRNKVVVSASAIGWYGPDAQVPNPKPFVETDAADNSFLGETCQQWEAAIAPAEMLGMRLVILRIGIVLSCEGGAYTAFRKPLRFGLSTILGDGNQVISWIHINDLVRLFIEAVENQGVRGIYNAVADVPVCNKDLVQSMAKAKGGIHLTMSAPAMILKAVLGEMSVEVLKSATVSNAKIRSAGFVFAYPTITEAVKELEGK